MNLHEYQSKQLFARYGIPVPAGHVASTPEEAVDAAKRLGGAVWVVKAQVHAGGRSKAGGVKVVKSVEDVRSAAVGMLGQRLKTKQTVAEGLPINQVYVETGSQIERELYLSLLLNRDSGHIAFVAGSHCRALAFGLGLKGDQVKQFESIARGLYKLYLECDCSLVEINPLIVTGDGGVMALDAKINIEDNALFRQKDLVAWRDPSQEDEMERIAGEADLNYVSLDGDIACMVNGAGLAMATMDLIKLHGGNPANFLDVGGGATRERVTTAFKLILQNPKVKAILVNIFGGIVRCDMIAEGVVGAARDLGLHLPVVVRIEGTNAAQGRKILQDSGLDLIAAADLTDAAKKVVAAARK